MQIIGNRIVQQYCQNPMAMAREFTLWIAGAPLIENNIIAFNQSGDSMAAVAES